MYICNADSGRLFNEKKGIIVLQFVHQFVYQSTALYQCMSSHLVSPFYHGYVFITFEKMSRATPFPSKRWLFVDEACPSIFEQFSHKDVLDMTGKASELR